MERICKIGNAPQCFFDNWIIEDMVGLRRRYRGFDKFEGNPVLEGEEPWEAPSGPATACILRERGVYRLYYEIPYETFAESGKSGRRNRHECVCYAESGDGVHWRKPALNVYPQFGEGNNVVLQGKDERINGMTIAVEPDAGEKRRYTALWKGRRSVYAATSADGIHWRHRDEPVIDYMNDTAMTVLPMPEGGWRLYGRNSVYAGHWQRRIAVYESPDLLHWSKPSTILMPECNDEYYGLRPFRYGDFYIGLLMWLYSTSSSALDCEWVFSRDGINWQQSGCKALCLGGEDDFDADRAIYTGYLDVEGDVIRTFYIGARGRHSAPLEEKRFSLGVASMRKEGFCCLDSGDTQYLAERVRTAALEDGKKVREEARMLTRPFVFEGNRLEINCDAANGRVDVAILDGETEPERRIDEDGCILGAYERPFDGLDTEDCDTVREDNVRHTVSWRGRTELPFLRGKTVRLLFAMRGAKLYSFTVKDDEELR